MARTCRSLLRDRAEAEDAAQNVFLAAHRALLAGVVPREPAAWLATIARHECWARSRALMSTPSPVGTDAEKQAAPHPAPDPLRSAELDALWTAIAELPRAQRDALLLREIRGLSYGQLARHLSLSGPAIRSLLERARRRVRLRLRDVHTAAGGIPWLETVARLFAGGSNPAAPVVRAAALGLGAAAITGGAIVTPTVLEHHVRPPVTRTAAAHPHHRSVRVHGAQTRVPHVEARRVEVVSVDRRVSSNRRGHASAHEGQRDEHHSTVGVTDRHDAPVPTGSISSGDGGSRSSHGDSHGGDTAVSTSGPAAPVIVSPVIVAPAVTIDGGGDSHGGDGSSSSSSGDLGGSDGLAGSGSGDLGGSDGSSGSDGH